MGAETSENEVFELGYAEPNPILYKYSERWEQRQEKTKFLYLAMPNILLCYANIIITERKSLNLSIKLKKVCQYIF